ncbi:response regulator SirA [Endozoicomonas montiporae]|uniref:Response regulator SirA n=2 Tax=Endozoicomonas montiporae TaxID=1027273 RepID=A0A081N9Y1_9GAMM|nr:sulfurtransferase TusA family protein [Endozoicomonas montiporae]AMO57078.1 sira-like domain-containing protein [Endozoicomonas montiporae CL-33]KEQ15254.1 response regulator SirA [Endozoicomonas montiporae]
MVEVDLELDLKGMNCPLPLLKAKQGLKQLSSGQMLRVQATDPGSVRDFASFARISGHELISSEQVSGVFIHTLRHK